MTLKSGVKHFSTECELNKVNGVKITGVYKSPWTSGRQERM